MGYWWLLSNCNPHIIDSSYSHKSDSVVSYMSIKSLLLCYGCNCYIPWAIGVATTLPSYKFINQSARFETSFYRFSWFTNGNDLIESVLRCFVQISIRNFWGAKTIDLIEEKFLKYFSFSCDAKIRQKHVYRDWCKRFCKDLYDLYRPESSYVGR